MKCSVCKKEGHNKNSCNMDATPISSTKVDVKIEPQIKLDFIKFPEWYKIHEVNKNTFLELIRSLYDVIEGKKVSKSESDFFAQQTWLSFHNMTIEEWEREHKKIQLERAWTMAWGDFHQNLMGSFPGWINYKKGHATGCDIGNEDKQCIAEVKNNVNTMNSSSRESVLNKLKKQSQLGKRALLVIINGDIRKNVKDGVETINGKQFYEELSGRQDFMDDLLETLKQSFSRYKTFESLKTALENS